jgi:hypothetical protein
MVKREEDVGMNFDLPNNTGRRELSGAVAI